MPPPQTEPEVNKELLQYFQVRHRQQLFTRGTLGVPSPETIQGGRATYLPPTLGTRGALESLNARYAEAMLGIGELVLDIAQSPVKWEVASDAKKEALYKGLTDDQASAFAAEKMRAYRPDYEKMNVWGILGRAERRLVESQENLNLIRVFHELPGMENSFVGMMSQAAEFTTEFAVGMIPWIPAMMNPTLLMPTAGLFASDKATRRLEETGNFGAAVGSGFIELARTLMIFHAAGRAAGEFGAAWGGAARGAREVSIRVEIALAREAAKKVTTAAERATSRKAITALEKKLGKLIVEGKTATAGRLVHKYLLRSKDVMRAVPTMGYDILFSAGLISANAHVADEIQMRIWMALEQEKKWQALNDKLLNRSVIGGWGRAYKAGVHEGATIMGLGMAHSVIGMRVADAKRRRQRQKELREGGTFESDLKGTMQDSILHDAHEAVDAVQRAGESPEGLSTLQRMAKDIAEKRARGEILTAVERQMEGIIFKRLGELDVPTIDLTELGHRNTGDYVDIKLEGSESTQRYYKKDDGTWQNGERAEYSTERFRDDAEFDAAIRESRGERAEAPAEAPAEARTLADTIKRDPQLSDAPLTHGREMLDADGANAVRPSGEELITDAEISRTQEAEAAEKRGPREEARPEEARPEEAPAAPAPTTLVRDSTESFLPEGDIRTTIEFRNRVGDIRDAFARGDMAEVGKIFREIRDMIRVSDAPVAKGMSKAIDRMLETTYRSKEDAVAGAKDTMRKIEEAIIQYGTRKFKKAANRANKNVGEAIRGMIASRLGNISMFTESVGVNWRERAIENTAEIADGTKKKEDFTEKEWSEIVLLEKGGRHHSEVSPIELMMAAREINSVIESSSMMFRVMKNRRREKEAKEKEDMAAEMDRERKTMILRRKKKIRKPMKERGGVVQRPGTLRTWLGRAKQMQLMTIAEWIGGGERSITYDIMYGALNRARGKIIGGDRALVDARFEFFESMGLTKRQARAFSDGIGMGSRGRYKQYVGSTKRLKGKIGGERMRLNHAIDLMQKLRDPGTRALAEEGISFWKEGSHADNTFQLSKDEIARLTDPSKAKSDLERTAHKIAQWQFDYVQNVLRPLMVDYQHRSGRDITIYENWYSRQWRRRGGRQIDESTVLDTRSDYAEGALENQSLTRERAKEHGGYDDVLIVTDGMMGLSKLVKQTHGLVHLAPAIARARRVLDDPRIDGMFKDSNFSAGKTQFDKYVKAATENVVGRRGKGAESAFIRHAVSLTTARQLVMNLGVGVSQVFSMSLARQYMPGHYLTISKTMLPLYTQLGQVKARAARSNYLWERFTQAPEGLINPGVATEGRVLPGFENVGVLAKSERMAWSIIRGMDTYVISRIWHGTELQVIDMIRRARRGERIEDYVTKEDITAEVKKLEHLVEAGPRGRMKDINNADFFNIVERFAMRTINKTQPTFNVLNLTGMGLARRESAAAHAFLMFRGFRDKTMDFVWGAHAASMRKLETRGGEIGILVAQEMSARREAAERGESYEAKKIVIPPGSMVIAGLGTAAAMGYLVWSTIAFTFWRETFKDWRGKKSIFSKDDKDVTPVAYAKVVAEALAGLHFLGDPFREAAELLQKVITQGPTGKYSAYKFMQDFKEAAAGMSPLADTGAEFAVEGVGGFGKAFYDYFRNGGDVPTLFEEVGKSLSNMTVLLGPHGWPKELLEDIQDILMEHVFVTDETAVRQQPKLPGGTESTIKPPTTSLRLPD